MTADNGQPLPVLPPHLVPGYIERARPERRWIIAAALGQKHGDSTEHRREMQNAAREALRQHALGERALPRELAIALAHGFDQLLAGCDYAPFLPVRPRGRPRASPAALDCMRIAATYRLMASEGIVADAHPMQTIMTAFKWTGGPDRRTVQKWCKSFSDLSINDVMSPFRRCAEEAIEEDAAGEARKTDREGSVVTKGRRPKRLRRADIEDRAKQFARDWIIEALENHGRCWVENFSGAGRVGRGGNITP